jgi:protein gp37
MTTTKISWTDHTINFWWGCTKVSPACQHCYAATMGTRFGPKLFGQPVLWGAGKPRFERLQSARKEALALNANAERCRLIRSIPMIRSGSVQNVGQPMHGILVADVRLPLKKRDIMEIPVAEWDHAPLYRPRVFVNSMSDWLDDEVPIEWLAYLLETIHLCPNLDFQLLTKRPENWGVRVLASCFHIAGYRDGKISASGPTAPEMQGGDTMWNWGKEAKPPPNIWIGCTAENQEWADKRISHLLEIPAKVRFLSCEPLLGPLDLHQALLGSLNETAYNALTHLHWVITGGESGGSARPSHPDWFRSLRDQCATAGVPFFFKQWGEWISVDNLKHGAEGSLAKSYQGHKHADGTLMLRLGTQLAGHLLDGTEHHAFPHPAT